MFGKSQFKTPSFQYKARERELGMIMIVHVKLMSFHSKITGQLAWIYRHNQLSTARNTSLFTGYREANGQV